MPNLVLHNILDRIRELHDRKSADYADTAEGNFYSNFQYAALVSEGFSNPVDRVFATLIGVKLARLQELTKPGRDKPNNESVMDSRMDLATYAAIWLAYHESEDIRTRSWEPPRKSRNRRRETGIRRSNNENPVLEPEHQ